MLFSTTLNRTRKAATCLVRVRVYVLPVPFRHVIVGDYIAKSYRFLSLVI